MPLRRSRVDALELISTTGAQVTPRPARQLGHVRPRDRRRARRPLRDPPPDRDGPFGVDEADPERVVARGGGARPPRGLGRRRREGRAVTPPSWARGHAPSRSARSTACTAATARCSRRRVDAGPRATVVTFDPHPRVAFGKQRRADHDPRAAARADRRGGVEEALVVARSTSSSPPRAGAVRRAVPPRDRRRGRRRGRGLPLRPRRAGRPPAAAAGSGSTRASCRASRASRRRSSAGSSRAGEVAAPHGCSAGRPEVEGIVVSGDARGGTLGYPTANLCVDRGLLVPRLRHLRGRVRRAPRRGLDRDEPALRRRGAAGRGVPARLRGRPLRPAARGRALAAAAGRAGVRSEAALVEQIGRDVAEARRRPARLSRAASFSCTRSRSWHERPRIRPSFAVRPRERPLPRLRRRLLEAIVATRSGTLAAPSAATSAGSRRPSRSVADERRRSAAGLRQRRPA